MHIRKTLSTIALAVSLAVSASTMTGCESTTSNSMTTDRSQLLLTDSKQVAAEAKQAYDQVLAQAKAQGVLNTDAALTKRVRNIGNKLIAKAPLFRPDSKDWDWEINVITSDELNAWCMAEGKIVVYSGLVKQLKLSDDEIATVMGHEIAHALREHVREQQSAEMIKQGLFSVASIFNVADESTLKLGETVANLGVSLPFSRSHETEADALGLELMYQAGYNPDKAVSLWEKMMAMGGSNEGIAALLSTHPAGSDRIANLKELAAKLKTTPRK